MYSATIRCFKNVNKPQQFSIVPSRCIRRVSTAEPLESVNMSYATYENTTAPNNTSPLIVMHGLFGSKSNWKSLCKAIQKKSDPPRKIIAVDARNHGESSHSENHTYAHMAADIRTLYDQLGVKKAVLLGHSMGGRSVMLFTLKYPELVEKLVVVDISPVTTSTSLSSMPEIFRALETVNLPTDVGMSQARSAVDSQLSKSIPDQSLRAFLLTNLIQKQTGSYEWRVNLPALLFNFNNIARFPLISDLQYKGPVLFLGGGKSDYIHYGWRFNVKALSENVDNILKFPDVHNSSYKGPVLFIGGAKSDHIQKSDYPKILELFPNAELKYIDGAGHWLHSEKPEEFLKLTIEFLNKKVDTRIS